MKTISHAMHDEYVEAYVYMGYIKDLLGVKTAKEALHICKVLKIGEESTQSMNDHATPERHDLIQKLQTQNFMEIADEELPRGGNSLATVFFILLALLGVALTLAIIKSHHAPASTHVAFLER